MNVKILLFRFKEEVTWMQKLVKMFTVRFNILINNYSFLQKGLKHIKIWLDWVLFFMCLSILPQLHNKCMMCNYIMQYFARRIYRGAVNLFLFRQCPSKIFWKFTIWNINIQYKNDWYTLQKLTKPVFAFRHYENLVSSSMYPSWSFYTL